LFLFCCCCIYLYVLYLYSLFHILLLPLQTYASMEYVCVCVCVCVCGGVSLLPTTCKILSNILPHMQTELLGIVSVDFGIIDQQLIRHSEFVRSWKKMVIYWDGILVIYRQL
jgi:hypothetical protein